MRKALGKKTGVQVIRLFPRVIEKGRRVGLKYDMAGKLVGEDARVEHFTSGMYFNIACPRCRTKKLRLIHESFRDKPQKKGPRKRVYVYLLACSDGCPGYYEYEEPFSPNPSGN